MLPRTQARHRKLPYHSPARPAHRHRKPSPVSSVLQNTPVRAAAAAVAGSALLVSAGPAATHLMVQAPRSGLGQADALGLAGSGAYQGRHASRPPAVPFGMHLRQHPAATASPAARRRPARHAKPTHGPHRAAHPPVYLNPLRGVSSLLPGRVDMGADFAGSGPVYAIGDAVITNATGSSGGWPGGGWITYRLTDGPDAGLMVYVAEDVTPAVRAGQRVSSSTVIASMFAGGDGIETGWAQPSGASAESQLPVAGGISGNGPFPTRIGLNFEELLQSLGVPAANNRTQPAYGLLPAAYPAQ